MIKFYTRDSTMAMKEVIADKSSLAAAMAEAVSFSSLAAERATTSSINYVCGWRNMVDPRRVFPIQTKRTKVQRDGRGGGHGRRTDISADGRDVGVMDLCHGFSFRHQGRKFSL
jgi:hypothetical protein